MHCFSTRDRANYLVLIDVAGTVSTVLVGLEQFKFSFNRLEIGIIIYGESYIIC
jgi:hypothetical protein